MNNRKIRYKRIRFIIIVIALLIVMLVMIVACIKSKENIKGSEEPNNSSTSVPPTKEKDDKITGISFSSENYTANTGETINTDTFKVKAIYESGKTKDINIKDNIVLSTDSTIFEIKDTTVVISDNALTADSGILTANYNGMTANLTIKIFNALKDNINADSVVTNENAYDMVVNKTRNLPSNYIPKDLVSLDGIPTSLQNLEINQLRKVAYDALKELFLKAKEEKSFELYARSGYRSYKTQKDLYNSYVSNHGQQAADKFSAKPGQSEHQSGLAMDITCAAMKYQLDDTFFDTEEGKWVAENAHRFGFIIRYPKGKEEITGYQYEPWHLRYVGPTLAKKIYESKLTLEEYFENN